MAESYTKVLCKLNLDNAMESYRVTYEGCTPKLCTGYLKSKWVTSWVFIPIRELIKQGVSIHVEELDWYDQGDGMIDDRPCMAFFESEVDILCS